MSCLAAVLGASQRLDDQRNSFQGHEYAETVVANRPQNYEHAVCLTGSERSFVEIGANIRQGVYTSLDSAAVAFFGVRPRDESWGLIRQLLPMNEVQLQEPPCFNQSVLNTTVSWLHCDFSGRSGDCRANFLQMLCDLAQCDRMMRAFTTRTASLPFRTVMRLRSDLFWEAQEEGKRL